MKYKPGILRISLCAAWLMGSYCAASAQAAEDDYSVSTEEAPPAPSRFALSANGGLCFSYTDVKPAKTAAVFSIGAAYFVTPYLHVNLDLQKGWLKGGDPGSAQALAIGSDNSFFAACVTARFLPLGLIENKKHNEALNIFAGLYGGVGLGLVSSSVKANMDAPPDYGSLGQYSGAAFMLPVEAGINIPVLEMRQQRRLFINFNYRINLCFSDKIDGYVPIVTANKKNDAYNTLTAGLVFNF